MGQSSWQLVSWQSRSEQHGIYPIKAQRENLKHGEHLGVILSDNILKLVSSCHYYTSVSLSAEKHKPDSSAMLHGIKFL